MKAAVLSSPGELSIKEVEEPDCPSGGALIKVEACAICPSDIKMAREGHRDLSYPRILGHEVVGKVIQADPALELPEGERIQVWPGLTCGTCPSCQTGRDNLCPEQGVLGFNRDGGFAQFMAVPAECARRGVNIIPSGLPSREATLTEPLACCVHAQNLCDVGEDAAVLVIGAGPMGLLHTMLARSRGAHAVVVEPREDRRKLALDIGAEEALEPSDNIEADTYAAFGRRGADVAILATPAADVPSLLRAMAPRGRICLFSGLPRANPVRPLDLNQIHYRELSMIGAYGCTSGSDHEALDLISSKRVAVDQLITMETSLERLNEGFRHIERRDGLKCVVTRF
ncbi:MAG: alcohol dehydrogenase catalytic domain-containing protein [Euryarchaeota archaeon]|nr:alcohol dehydrogenase catalytic domain-containing protein [Euryarchaeota archaeon]